MTGLKVKFTFGNQTWFFRRPQIGNQDELAFTRISRKTRGGDLIIFRDPEWPKTETQVITFDFNTEAELRQMQTMMKQTIGEIITYTDHENKNWVGFIANPDADGVQSGINHYVITLRFEGDLQ